MTTTAQIMDTKPRRVVYPTRDGKPMAETDKHAELMMYARQALKVFFAGRSDVYVSGNNFVFWEEGNPKARISPDAYVVFGPTPNLRDSYMAWKEEDRLPAVIFEFTSRKTQQEDTDTKLPLYEQTLKTPEYFLFDPTGDYLKPRLQGYRLVGDRYMRLELLDNRLHSEQLGLDLVQWDETLRFYDPQKGEFLLTAQEQADRAAQETQRAEIETQRAEMEAKRAETAEAEIARLRAELDALRNENA
jgi:Uma2 family endonuclease